MTAESVAKFIMDMLESLCENVMTLNSTIINWMVRIAIVSTVLSVLFTVIGVYTFISIGEAIVSLAFLLLLKYGYKLTKLGGIINDNSR